MAVVLELSTYFMSGVVISHTIKHKMQTKVRECAAQIGNISNVDVVFPDQNDVLSWLQHTTFCINHFNHQVKRKFYLYLI